MHKVGNLPYDINEDEVVRIFQEVGPVKDFRMNFDRHTGKPKGYGFVEYYGAFGWEVEMRAQR